MRLRDLVKVPFEWRRKRKEWEDRKAKMRAEAIKMLVEIQRRREGGGNS